MKNKSAAAIVGGLVVAAAVLYLIKRSRHFTKDTPPANAPQLSINNPGEQSDFPAAPTGDKGLG